MSKNNIAAKESLNFDAFVEFLNAENILIQDIFDGAVDALRYLTVNPREEADPLQFADCCNTLWKIKDVMGTMIKG